MKKTHMILSLVIIAAIAYPIYLLGEEIGGILANDQWKGIAIILIIIGLTIPTYFLGIKVGRRYISKKFIKK